MTHCLGKNYGLHGYASCKRARSMALDWAWWQADTPKRTQSDDRVTALVH